LHKASKIHLYLSYPICSMERAYQQIHLDWWKRLSWCLAMGWKTQERHSCRGLVPSTPQQFRRSSRLSRSICW